MNEEYKTVEFWENATPYDLAEFANAVFDAAEAPPVLPALTRDAVAAAQAVMWDQVEWPGTAQQLRRKPGLVT